MIQSFGSASAGPLLVGQHESYVKVAFNDEAEIERVVHAYAEQLFGAQQVLARSEVKAIGSRPFQELITAMPELIGQTVRLEYGPPGGARQGSAVLPGRRADLKRSRELMERAVLHFRVNSQFAYEFRVF
jgi:hypothetical protein